LLDVPLALQLGAPQAWFESLRLRTFLPGRGRILGLTALLLFFVRRGTHQRISTVEDLPATDPKRQRAVALSNLLRSTARYAVWAVGAIMVLSELGLDIGTLLATAGIAGLAVGSGAQTLVQDVIGGIFLPFLEVSLSRRAAHVIRADAAFSPPEPNDQPEPSAPSASDESN